MWIGAIMFFSVCFITYMAKKLWSKEPSKFKFQFYFLTFYILTSLLAIVLLPYFLLRPKNVRNIIVATRILKHISKIFDLKWELRNGEILSEERGAIIVSNHQSSLDILGMFNIWEIADKLTVVARNQVFWVWPMGLAAYLTGIIFIDRSNAKTAYRTLNAATDIIVKEKTKVWLFPEGTRNKDYTKLLPFKKGAFTMAVRAQVPIVPVLFSPYYFIDAKKHVFNKGHVIIKCLDPIPSKGLTMDDVPDLTERVFNLMQQSYMELSKEVRFSLHNDYPYSAVG